MESVPAPSASTPNAITALAATPPSGPESLLNKILTRLRAAAKAPIAFCLAFLASALEHVGLEHPNVGVIGELAELDDVDLMMVQDRLPDAFANMDIWARTRTIYAGEFSAA